MVGSVPYGLVRWVGMSLILGGGRPPDPRFYVFLCIYSDIHKLSTPTLSLPSKPPSKKQLTPHAIYLDLS